MGSQLYGRQVHAPARRVDLYHLHRDGVADADAARRAGADEGGLELVELPPVAAQAPDGQQPLVAVPEADERPGADHPGDLARELALPPVLEEQLLEQEAAGDVVGAALDRHRVALARGAPGRRLLEAPA